MTRHARASLHRLSRRSFVRGASWIGAGLAATPWLPLPGMAESTVLPRRLLLLFQPNGTAPEHWWPSGTTDDWTLGPNLQALAPYQDQLIFLDGLYKYGQRYDQDGGPGNEHRKGISMLWTGHRNIEVDGESWSGGTSIDQTIAAAIGSQTPFRSLELSVRSGDSFYGNRMIYAGPGQPLPPESDPAAAFARLFADAAVSETDLERIRSERRSVIDGAREDIARVRDRLGARDREKLEAHLEGLRALERRIDRATTCEVPQDPPTVSGLLDGPTSRAQIDNLVLALSCDLTRVASLQYGSANTLQSHNGAPHHELTHRIADQHDTQALQELEVIDRWYGGQVAYLLERLSAIPEGDGSLLDNTLVVWGNEIANGVTYETRGKTHLMGRIPWMMAGGGNFAFPTGRYLRYEQPADMNETDPSRWPVHHHRVLVAIAQAFGLAIESYGDLDQGQGGPPLL